ncbi:MAG: 4Fe-4S dicluster domain-containing protein [Desulfobacterales bacterium]
MACLQTPNLSLGRQLAQLSSSAASMCYTCSSCDLECPVDIATGSLRPQKIVRKANLGFLEELLNSPDIWYCLTCRHCTKVCPNVVSPSTLIEYLRRDALSKGIVSIDTFRQYQRLFTEFQRIRWQAINISFKETVDNFTDRMWNNWLQKPIIFPTPLIKLPRISQFTSDAKAILGSTRASACYTCGECSSACPIVCDGFVFDPRLLFRMINLGLIVELVRFPSIWLCISCGRCTESCSQLVDGRYIMEQIKELAIQRRIVDKDFHMRVQNANQLIYRHFIHKIDFLFVK